MPTPPAPTTVTTRAPVSYVEIAVAPAQGARGLDLQGQAHVTGQAQAGGHDGRALSPGQRPPAAARGVTDRQSGEGGDIGKGQAGLAQGFGQGMAGQEILVEGDGHVVAAAIGEEALHTDGRRDAVLHQRAGQDGISSTGGGVAGAEEHQLEHAGGRQGGQVRAVQVVGAAGSVLQQEQRQGAVLGLDDVAVAGEVEDGRPLPQRPAEGVAGRGRAVGDQVGVAGAQGAADGAQFVVDAQATIVAGPALIVDQGIGAQDDEAQGVGRRGRGGGPIDQADEGELAGQELGAVHGGELPGDGGGGGAVGVEEEQALGFIPVPIPVPIRQPG